MAVLFALIATVLTSFLPILNKYLLRDARPAFVAWITNAASLPLLLLGTLLLTQCSLSWSGNPLLSCTLQMPHVDGIFVGALLVSVVLNWGATWLSTVALSKADAGLVSPLLTFNPAFTLLVAWPALGEVPGVRQTLGVGVVLLGAYVLEVEQVRMGMLAPLRLLLRRAGATLALLASTLWGMTTVLEKLAINHMTPPSGPAVALLGTFFLVAILTPGALWTRSRKGAQESRWRGISRHPRSFSTSVLLTGIAPLFGFTAVALGLVGYVTAIFKLSAVLTVLWAWWFLGEGQIRNRLIGTGVMILGGLLVAV
jgi:uncharacterized membrane protein